ncbi:MAG: carbohydrate ABC transporter permease [Chloroflexi bacterium]|nr:carbohydrate ABC transporter permease [Chloroflexota bacterium]MBV9898127.1 carbohydrate ABC transporter permease [Chloroflexota bacterium]
MAAAPPQPFIRTEQPAAVQARPPRDLVNRALSDPVRLGVYALLTLVGVLSLFPLYWLFVTSLSPTQFVIKVPPEVLPHTFTLVNYQRLFTTTPVIRWLANTLLIAGTITVFHLLFDSMAGYAFAKRQFPGRNVLFWLVLSTLTVPAQVTLIPVFFILKDLNLLDSYPGVILPGFADVFGVFLMKQYIQTLPSELEAAGRVDGASEWQIYQHIILPLCTPALAVLAIFTFQRYWNGFILPLVVLHDSFKYPIQVGLATLQGEFNTDYGMLMTGAAVAAVPMMLVFFAFQRYFVEGIRIGGVKG